VKKVAIIGAGAWGTALSGIVSRRSETVRLWVREADLAVRMTVTGVNDMFLPGIRLAANVFPTTSLQEAVADVDLIVSVMPSHAVRPLHRELAPYLPPGIPIVSATKGLESGTLLRMSEVITEVVGDARRVAVLSGPSFALEVASGVPTAVVLAAQDAGLAQQLQIALSGPSFRIYASSDLPGVEIGGALKNVIAIGAGICDGLKLGHNSAAALITRGLAELTRLAVAVGGKLETLAGLSGLGDLILTCYGDLSRNRQVGLKLAAGLKLEGIISSTASVAEGVKTTGVARELAARHHVEMPIVNEMHAVLNEGRAPAEALRRLMSRSLRAETT
jgi:glycerol-3-phosphate dehydrogenase (NAD(P)+)